MSAYREGFGPIEQRRAEVALVRARVAEAEPALTAVVGARIGRLVGALVGLVGLVLLGPIAFALSDVVTGRGFIAGWFFGSAAAAVASSFVYRQAHALVHRLRRRRARREAPEAHAAAELLRAHDLEAVEAWNPWPRLAGRLSALEAPSLIAPLVLASFVLPLLAHALLFVPFTLLSGAEPLAPFSNWIAISAVVVGHAHVALAICAGRYGAKIARTSTDALVDGAYEKDADGNRKRDWIRAFYIAVGVASAPGVILLAIPTLLALITGLAVIPLMYGLAKRALLQERMVTDAITHDVEGIRIDLAEAEVARGELVRIASSVPTTATVEDREELEEREEREEREEDADADDVVERRSRRA